MKESDEIAPVHEHNMLLFVSGMSIKSAHAIENLQKICDEYVPGNYKIEIIDVAVHKQQAVAFQIIGVPTLIRTDPKPPRIIIGDLSDTNKVLKILDLI